MGDHSEKISPPEKPQLTADTQEAIEPEIVSDDTEERGGIEGVFRRRVLNARRRIEKFIEARAIKRGMDPEPIIEAAWEALLLLPRLLVLTAKLLADSRVPLGLRIKCGLALAYVVSPIDLLSEAVLGPLALLDDLAIIMIVLDVLLNEVDPAVIQEKWTGSEDVLRIVRGSVGMLRLFLPPSIYDKIIAFFRR